MGAKTRAGIITEGMLLAGRDDLGTRAITWLQMWLDSQAAAWLWPELIKEGATVTVSTGVNTVAVGAGNGGITNSIVRILDNVWLYNSAKTKRKRLRIKQLLSAPNSTIVDSTTNRGMPVECRIKKDHDAGATSWVFHLNPTPDEGYLLCFDYVELPEALSGDGSYPWYPNDQTMVQLVQTQCLLYAHGASAAEYEVALKVLQEMAALDKVRYGRVDGTNDVVQLDSAVFA